MRGRTANAQGCVLLLSYSLAFVVCIYIAGRIWHSTIPTVTLEEVETTLRTSTDKQSSLVEEPLAMTAGNGDNEPVEDYRLVMEAKSGTDAKLMPRKTTDIIKQVERTHDAIRTLGKTMTALEMELAAARGRERNAKNGSSPEGSGVKSQPRKKAFLVIGINTAFSSRRRRDSLRETWMPTGDKLQKLEDEKGIAIRFVIGYSATRGGILDQAIDAEQKKFQDIMRMEHVEGYLELSGKTKVFFATAIAIWDAEFFVKVDDDVHLNLGMLGSMLLIHRSKPRVYIGCMKTGPVLSKKGVKYHEPEFWKFGEEGNKYFRHATGQVYVISKDLATYISINEPILHRYANEDVSLGSWFIGLDVEYVDERAMCCGTPPDCEWKAQAGNLCIASFDWACSGICKSSERIMDVHQRCGEGADAVWVGSW